METQIFESIINSGGLALALAILFYYSVSMFKSTAKEHAELKTSIIKLQNDISGFKDETIKRLYDLQVETNQVLDKIADSIINYCKFNKDAESKPKEKTR